MNEEFCMGWVVSVGDDEFDENVVDVDEETDYDQCRDELADKIEATNSYEYRYDILLVA